MSDERAKKRALRAAARQRRRALLPEHAAELGDRIGVRVAALCSDAAHVALFHPMLERREVDLRGLDAGLRAQGASVYYPWSAPTESAGGCFRLAPSLETLERHPLGFLQPSAWSPEATRLDVVVVPALLATRRGERLGYGAGYYDRALAAWPEARSIVVVYGFELCESLPVEPHDRRVQWVVTEAETLGPLSAPTPA